MVNGKIYVHLVNDNRIVYDNSQYWQQFVTSMFCPESQDKSSAVLYQTVAIHLLYTYLYTTPVLILIIY